MLRATHGHPASPLNVTVSKKGRACLFLSKPVALPHIPVSAINLPVPRDQTLQPNCADCPSESPGAVLKMF